MKPNDQKSDEHIIRLLKANDVEGLSLLYDKYAAALFGTIFRILQNNEAAEEVLQDTILKIWKNFASYDPNRGALFTWSVNVARNAAIDRKRLKSFNIKNQELDTSIKAIDNQDNTYINPETIDLKDLTNKLRPEEKSVIDLVYFNGYSQSEAAEALAIPLGTVKTRLRAAIIKLRELF